MANEEQMGMKE